MSQALLNYDAVQESAAQADAVLSANPTLTAIFVRRAETKALVAVNDFAQAVEKAAAADGRNSPSTTTSALEDVVAQRGNRDEDNKLGVALASGDRAIFVSARPPAKNFV